MRVAVGLYIALGIGWIVGSDQLLESFRLSPEASSTVQSMKGTVFVLLSAAWAISVVMISLAHQQRELDREHARSLERVNDRLLKTFFDLPFVGIAFTSPDSKRWARFNDRLCTILGYPRIELAQLTWAELTHPDDLDADLVQFERLLAGESDGYNVEKRFLRKDGAVVHAFIDVRCVRRPDGSIENLVALIDDITDDKLARTALRESEARWQGVVAEAPFPMMVHDESGRIRMLSRAWVELSGYTREELPDIPAWLALAYPGKGASARIRRHIAGLYGRLERVDEGVYIIRCRDGGLRRWMFSSVALGVDDQGLRVAVSMAADLTEHGRLVDALRDSEEIYRSMFEANPMCMLVWDAESHAILAANQATVDRYGWTADALREMRIDDLHLPEQDMHVAALLANPRLAGTQLGVFRHRSSDGAVLHMEVSMHGTTFGDRPAWLSMAVDVSERERTRAELDHYVEELERATHGALSVVSTMVEMRDPYTAGHERRVGELAASIGAEMGLDDSQQLSLRMCGLVHDVGKIAVPAEILSKPGRLSALEYQVVQQHASQGYEILSGINFTWPLAEVARQHHERLDGSGYPRGLKGDEILLEARIIAVADVVESMASHRPYRPALGPAPALAEIEAGRGRLFDSAAVDACLRLFRERGYELPA